MMNRYFANEIKSQSGRSIIEIIAVLLLIGLLSVTSLGGYHWAINKYRSNVLESEIMQRVADVKIQLDRPHAVATLDKWPPKSTLGYPIDLEQDKDVAHIHVRQVNNRFCHVITEDLEKLPGIARIEIDGGTCDKEDNNTITFYLSKMESPSIIKPVCTCDDPKVCNANGDCICPPTSPIGYDTQTCDCPIVQINDDGECVCPDGSMFVNGECGGCFSDEDCDGEKTCEHHICTCVRKECAQSDFAQTRCACCPSNAPKWVDDEGICKACDEIDVATPVYDVATKTCIACPSDKPIWDNLNNQCVECVYNTDCGAGFVCTNNVCECAQGTNTPCATNLIQTVKTSVYEQMCYICSCPSGSTMSGDTCVCNNECQTYNTSTKTCTNKTNGTTCSSGLCLNGSCKNDTCPTGTSKSCSANLVATASSKTAYGTQCYTCACPSGSTLSSDGTTCVCNNECQTYNASTKTCVSKTDGTTCSDGLCLSGVCTNDTCPSGSSKTCSANLVATASSKTAYGTQCYTCGCPSGSTLSSDGTTCVCNNECQTYNTSTKTCTNKTNGTTCSTGLCLNGSCKDDTCPSGTAKSCSSGYTANKVSTTTYGSACYRCCASPKTYWNGSTCACPTSTPQYASTSTCACASGETNKNGVCTPDLYPTCATYCQNRNSTSSSTTGQTCSSFTTLNGLNSVVSLQHSVSSTGSKSYEVVIKYTNKNNGGTETFTNKANGQEFETLCGYGTATVSGSDVNIYLQTTSTHTLCKGHKAGWIYCPVSGSKEISNAQKTTCNTFCNTYASRYGW